MSSKAYTLTHCSWSHPWYWKTNVLETHLKSLKYLEKSSIVYWSFVFLLSWRDLYWHSYISAIFQFVLIIYRAFALRLGKKRVHYKITVRRSINIICRFYQWKLLKSEFFCFKLKPYWIEILMFRVKLISFNQEHSPKILLLWVKFL